MSGMMSGAMGGASMGAAAGPYGAAIGAVAGGIMGGVKGQKAEDAQNIASSNPAEVARLAELRNTSKQLQSGTDPLTQLNIRENQRGVRAAQHGIARVTGGDVGGTISAMRKAQMAGQTGNNAAIAGAAKRVPYFDSAVGGLTSRIADRKLQLNLLKRGQATAESAQYQTDANVSGNAFLGAVGGGLFSGQGQEGAAPTATSLGTANAGGQLPVASQPPVGINPNSSFTFGQGAPATLPNTFQQSNGL
jgi:hypothetical protein